MKIAWKMNREGLGELNYLYRDTGLEEIGGFAVRGSPSDQALAWVSRRDRRVFQSRRTGYLHALEGLLEASGPASLWIARFFVMGGCVR